ncbi:MAG: hypothetical protein ACRELF_18140, partial [Gemmataceae bacterium]
ASQARPTSTVPPDAPSAISTKITRRIDMVASSAGAIGWMRRRLGRFYCAPGGKLSDEGIVPLIY